MDKVYRQGDVVIRLGVPIPKLAKKLDHLVLATGEATHHRHQITEGTATLFEHEGTLFLRVDSESATLTHEEHRSLVLPKATYRVTIQREYVPDGWRRVAD